MRDRYLSDLKKICERETFRCGSPDFYMVYSEIREKHKKYPMWHLLKFMEDFYDYHTDEKLLSIEKSLEENRLFTYCKECVGGIQFKTSGNCICELCGGTQIVPKVEP